MFISNECFRDSEIRAMIEKDGELGDCDILNIKSVIGYNTKNDQRSFNISDNISEILNIYTPISELPKNFPQDKLDYIENIIIEKWSIFSDCLRSEQVKKMIQEICLSSFAIDSLIYKEKVGIEELCNPEYLKRKCLTKETDWDSFMSSIKSINRFHSSHLNLEMLGTFFESESLLTVFSKGDDSIKLYRGRICGPSALKQEEMGVPPKDKTIAGRVNSQGIRCLYLTNGINSALHEIKARDYDYVSVGIFYPRDEMKIVDLSVLNRISPFAFATESRFDIEWFAINMPIIKKICYEIAKPLSRQDNELDYLPTQYIADLIKSRGFDGICYQSTLMNEGKNYAIFYPKKFACESVKLVHINSIDFSFEIVEE